MAEPIGRIQIRGLSELRRALKSLPMKLRLKVLRKALRGAGDIFKMQAILNAPVDTGALAEGMVVRVRTLRGDRTALIVLIGPSRDEFYGVFLEFGTEHQDGTRWMTRAFESRVEDAQAYVHEQVRAGLPKAVR